MSDYGFSLTRIFPYKENSTILSLYEKIRKIETRILLYFLQWDKHLFRRTPLGCCFWNIWKYSPLLFCHFTIFLKTVPQRNSRGTLPEVFLKKDTAEIMSDYGFSLTRNFPYKDGIYDSVLIRENTDNRKPVLWYMFCSGINTFLEEHRWGTASETFGDVLHYFSVISPFFQKQSPKETPEAVSQMCFSKRTLPKLCQTTGFLWPVFSRIRKTPF